jgi:hypothetical protein
LDCFLEPVKKASIISKKWRLNNIITKTPAPAEHQELLLRINKILYCKPGCHDTYILQYFDVGKE